MQQPSLPRPLFDNIITHHHTSNKAACYFNLAETGIIKVSGQDASKLLQNQCTINVQSLGEQKAQISAICNLKGRVLSLFYLLKKHDDFYLLLPMSLLDPTIQLLKKYAVFFKLTISDVSTQYALYGAFHDANKSSTDYYSINQDLGLLLLTTHRQGHYLPEAEWNKLLLYYKYPRLYAGGIDKWLPYELGLLALGAIDFEKGCYIGQEIIARMHYRSKRSFVILAAIIQSDTSPLYEELIDHDKQLVGTVIDTLSLDHDRFLALLSIKDGVYQEPLFLLKNDRYHIELLTSALEH